MSYRYKLIIEYDGTSYVGWQRQENGPSIQEALEKAAYGFCGETVTAAAAGRTDAGVHALGMVAHIDLDQDHEPRTVRDALNFHLKPAPIAIIEAIRVSEDFHARFSAAARHYLYRFKNRRAPVALDAGRIWHIVGDLDANAMHEGAQYLVGTHDFSTFRAAQCQAQTPVKSLSTISCARDGDEIQLKVSARSFLHNQVRSIAGSLVQVGLGKWQPDDIGKILKAADRAACGPVAPAHGLYFVTADYGQKK